MSECNNRIRAQDEIRDFPGEFSSEHFTEMLLSYLFGPSVIKYGILSNNRRGKLHAVIGCLFLFVLTHLCSRPPAVYK